VVADDAAAITAPPAAANLRRQMTGRRAYTSAGGLASVRIQYCAPRRAAPRTENNDVCLVLAWLIFNLATSPRA